MFRKKYKVVLKVVVLAIVLGVLLNACSKRQTVTEEYNTISDLAYSEKCKIEPIIYIEEKTDQQFRWLLEGLKIEQPRTIKKSNKRCAI